MPFFFGLRGAKFWGRVLVVFVDEGLIVDFAGANWLLCGFREFHEAVEHVGGVRSEVMIFFCVFAQVVEFPVGIAALIGLPVVVAGRDLVTEFQYQDDPSVCR